MTSPRCFPLPWSIEERGATHRGQHGEAAGSLVWARVSVIVVLAIMLFEREVWIIR
jgi:hypothetical protein